MHNMPGAHHMPKTDPLMLLLIMMIMNPGMLGGMGENSIMFFMLLFMLMSDGGRPY